MVKSDSIEGNNDLMGRKTKNWWSLNLIGRLGDALRGSNLKKQRERREKEMNFLAVDVKKE